MPKILVIVFSFLPEDDEKRCQIPHDPFTGLSNTKSWSVFLMHSSFELLDDR